MIDNKISCKFGGALRGIARDLQRRHHICASKNARFVSRREEHMCVCRRVIAYREFILRTLNSQNLVRRLGFTTFQRIEQALVDGHVARNDTRIERVCSNRRIPTVPSKLPVRIGRIVHNYNGEWIRSIIILISSSGAGCLCWNVLRLSVDFMWIG